MTALRRIPAVLSALVLAAHFYRAGSLALTGLCVLLCALFFVGTPLVVLIARGLLVSGAGIWMFNAGWIAHGRAVAGRPWMRMAAILIGVAAFTALSAWVLPTWCAAWVRNLPRQEKR